MNTIKFYLTCGLYLLSMSLTGLLYADPSPLAYGMAGSVELGKQYVSRLNDNLMFMLVPEANGWQIAICERSDYLARRKHCENLAALTVPVQGDNPLVIEEYETKNPKDTRPPVRSRELEFAMSIVDLQNALRQLDCTVGGVGARFRCDSPDRVYRGPPARRGQAVLRLDKIVLDSMNDEGVAKVKRIEFFLRGCLAHECKKGG